MECLFSMSPLPCARRTRAACGPQTRTCFPFPCGRVIENDDSTDVNWTEHRIRASGTRSYDGLDAFETLFSITPLALVPAT